MFTGLHLVAGCQTTIENNVSPSFTKELMFWSHWHKLCIQLNMKISKLIPSSLRLSVKYNWSLNWGGECTAMALEVVDRMSLNLETHHQNVDCKFILFIIRQNNVIINYPARIRAICKITLTCLFCFIHFLSSCSCDHYGYLYLLTYVNTAELMTGLFSSKWRLMMEIEVNLNFPFFTYLNYVKLSPSKLKSIYTICSRRILRLAINGKNISRVNPSSFVFIVHLQRILL